MLSRLKVDFWGFCYRRYWKDLITVCLSCYETKGGEKCGEGGKNSVYVGQWSRYKLGVCVVIKHKAVGSGGRGAKTVYVRQWSRYSVCTVRYKYDLSYSPLIFANLQWSLPSRCWRACRSLLRACSGSASSPAALPAQPTLPININRDISCGIM